MDDSKTEARKAQMSLESLLWETKECSENDGDMSEGHRNQLEGGSDWSKEKQFKNQNK